MKARMPAGFGRPDMNALMRQAQKMQDDMKAKQAELEAAEYTGSASGEMVTVRMNGKHEILGITIKPEAVDPDDIEMLEDLVAAAVNATVKQVEDVYKRQGSLPSVLFHSVLFLRCFAASCTSESAFPESFFPRLRHRGSAKFLT